MIVGSTRYFPVFHCALILLLVVGIGCATTDEDSDWNYYEGGVGASVFEMLGSQDSLAGGHIIRDAPVKEPQMASADREFLQDLCEDCHNLNRVFWSRGPRSMWESVLSKEQHLEMDLEPDKQKRLYKILLKYLGDQ